MFARLRPSRRITPARGRRPALSPIIAGLALSCQFACGGPASQTVTGDATRSGQPSAQSTRGDRSNAGAGANASDTSAGPPRVLAYVDARPITLADVYTPLMETAGREILTEAVLDRTLERRMAQRGLDVSAQMMQQERQTLTSRLSADPNEAERLLDDLRARRGLGDVRFERLLHRNAALRLLVADEVEISEAAIVQQYALEHGPTVQVRLLVASDVETAAALRQRVLGGDAFGEVAAMESIDPSSSTGGLLEPFNLADGRYPQAIRDAAGDLEPGDLSGVIATETGFAVIQLVQRNPGDGAQLANVHDELARTVRLRVERQAMDQLARTLLAEADFTPLDPAVQRAWQPPADATP